LTTPPTDAGKIPFGEHIKEVAACVFKSAMLDGELLSSSASRSQKKIEIPAAARVAPSGENATDEAHGNLGFTLLAQLPSLISHRRSLHHRTQRQVMTQRMKMRLKLL
jgi:hypothetical protein